MFEGLVGFGSTSGGEQIVVQYRRVIRHRRIDVDHVRQHFLLHVDQVERRIADCLRRRRNGGHGVTLIQRLATRHAVARQVTEIDGPSPTNASSDAMFGRSSAVITACTPGSFNALLVSIDTMRACACGERFTLPHSMPGRTESAPNMARPVTLSTPSGRTGRVPTTSRIGANVIHSAASLRISAAASITARMILS